MEDFEICHITSVYALNRSAFIRFMLAISEDMIDTRRERRARGERTKCARNQKQYTTEESLSLTVNFSHPIQITYKEKITHIPDI